MTTPVAQADQYTLVQGSTLTVTALNGLLVNDTDAENDLLSAAIEYNPSHGSLTFNTDGTFTYKPYNPSFVGEDFFTYYTTDASGRSESVRVNLAVTASTEANQGPVATSDTYAVTGSTIEIGAANGVLKNDSDPDADPLAASVLWQGGWGTVTMNADGSFSYTLAPWATAANGFNGTDSFYYTVSDGQTTSDPIKVDLTFAPSTEPGPVAVADQITLTAETDGRYSGTTVLANDTVADGAEPALVYNPMFGTVTLNEDGTFSYQLADWATNHPNYSGTDEFFYKVGDSEVVKVSVTIPAVTPENAVPVAQADTFDVTLAADGTFTSSVSLLANDTDAEGNPLMAVKQWDAGWGTVTVKADGTFTYKLAEWATETNGFKGSDEFFYYAKDASGQSQIVKVSLTNIQRGATEEPEPVVPEINVSGTAEVTEGGVATYSFTRTGNTNEALDIAVTVGGTAVAGQDYGTAPTKVTFPAGSKTATLTIQTTNDTAVEDAKTIEVAVAPGAGYTAGAADSAATDLISEDQPAPVELPVVSATSAPGEVTEGGVATFGVIRTGDLSGPLTVNIDASFGSATAGSDFTAPTTVTFAADSATATFSVQTNTDTAVEAAETIEFRIAEGSGYTVGAADGNVTDLVDAPPAPTLPTLSITDASISEGGNANFRLLLSEPVNVPVTVTYQVVHGTTTTSPGTPDVTVGTFTLNIAAGVTNRGFNIPTIEDALFEPNETFTVKVLSVKTAAGADAATIVDGEATGTIVNDDAAPAADPGVTLSKTNLAVTEGGATDTFTVVLDAPPTANVTVQVSTGNELMALGPNGSSNLVFTTANWNVPQTVTVRSEDDGLVEGAHEDFVYFQTTSADTRYDGMLVDTMMPVAITDAAPEPAMPYVTVANLGGAVTEGGEMTFTFHRSDASDGDLALVWEMTGLDPSDIQAVKWNGVEGDFEGFKGTSQTATMTVVLADDAVVEQAETLTVKVLPSDTYLYDDPFTATGTVNDNDTAAPALTVSVDDVTVLEDVDGGQMGFKVKLSAPATQDVKVSWTMTGGTATAEEDYSNPGSGELWFMEGDQELTVIVPVFSDGDVEGDETIFFDIAVTEGNATVEKGRGIGTLTNDDVAPPVLPEISVSAPATGVNEGGAITYTFTRTGNTEAALDVAYTVNGNATAGSDFAAPSGTVTFAAGSNTATVTVQTTDDSADEANETVGVTVQAIAAYTVSPQAGSASGSILDNDEPVVIPPTNQTITASTTAASFTGGAGIDTLVFPVIPAGGVQMLGGSTVVDSTISLGGTISGTVYNGKTISAIENLTFNDIQGPAGRTLTINGDAKDNTITVARTTKKLFVNGGDGADIINYTGTGLEAQGSVISGGTGNDTVKVTSVAIIDDRAGAGASGNDTYDLGTTARQEIRFGANNGNDTIKNYSLGDGTIQPDVLDFAAAGIDASTMTVKEIGGNTVFTINGGSTVTVEGVTGLQFGTHWKALGTYTPPVEEPPPGGDEEPTGEAGIELSKFSLNVAEGGATDSVDVVLTRKPTAPVTIQLGSDGGVSFDKASLTFTPQNWNQTQTVTVTADDDADYEPGGGTTMYFEPITSDDPLYMDIFPPMPWVSIADNDTAPDVPPPTAQVMSADVWEDNPVVELQGNGYSEHEFGITEYKIVSQPVEGGTVSMTDDRTFRFDGDEAFLSSLNRGEKKAITFEYAVKDGAGVWSEPATMTFNVHGFTNGADETVEAKETGVQPFGLSHNGGDGIDTLVFNSVELTSGSGLEVSLDHGFVWTNYGGGIENFESLTIKATTGNLARTMTVGGDGGNNVITVESTGHKLTLAGLNGDDTFNFNGTGNGLNSIITGGSGNDTVNANSGLFIDDRGSAGGLSGDDAYHFGNGVQHGRFYAGNGQDTVTNFEKGVDKLHFLGGLNNASVVATEEGGNTVFTINGTSTVTVANVTGLTAGTDWLFT